MSPSNTLSTSRLDASSATHRCQFYIRGQADLHQGNLESPSNHGGAVIVNQKDFSFTPHNFF
jgi:hypothetical protein